MIKFGANSKQIIRESFEAAKDNQEEILQSSIDDALEYLSRRSDVETVRKALKSRFAVGLTKIGTDEKGNGGWEAYSKTQLATAIDLGLYESVSSGLGNKIINSLSNLFTQPTQSWQFISENGEVVEEVAAIISDQRAAGAFLTEIIKCDRISNAVETAVMLVQVAGDQLSYKAINPNCIHVVHGTSVTENNISRAAIQTELEDAICIVIKLSSPDNLASNNSYLAIFGRSEEYPQGRYVQYSATNWKMIPRVGEKNATDYLIDGEIANPLSWLANRSDRNVPEYPIIVLSGGQALTKSKVIEINNSLFESCQEIDISYSRILKDALVSSCGIKAIRNPDGSALPRSLEGTIALNGEQSIEIIATNGSNCQAALQVVGEISKSIAEGFCVPGFSVVTSQTPESGISLYLRTQPLIDNRNYRLKLNQNQINRIFEIELSLLEITTGKNFGVVKQIWNPGSINLPETPTEKTARIQASLDAGLISYVQAVRDFHNLPTDQDAMDFIDTINDHNGAYSKPKQASSGLPFNIKPRS